MKKILLLLLPIVILLALLTQLDDELGPEATALLDRIDLSAQSASYTYLLGIEAHEDEDPADVGTRLLEEIRKREADDAYQVVEYPESKRLALPTGELFCAIREEGCINSLFESKLDILQLTREHATLIDRSRQFLDFNEFTTLARPSSQERLPPYQHVATGERLKVLEAISLYRNGENDAAVASLLQQFEALRRGLALQDQLIGKMVFLIKLSDIIDVLSVMLYETGGKIEPIQELTLDERDFAAVSAREFAMNYYALKGQDRHPSFSEPDIELPRWIARAFFKPNMTINAVAPTYQRFHRLSRLTPAEFVAHTQGDSSTSPSASSMLRKPAGSVLAQVVGNYEEYVSPFMDFQAKIALFNHLYHLKGDLTEASNPYYPSEAPEVSDGKACFRGPLRDFRSIRCLRIKR